MELSKESAGDLKVGWFFVLEEKTGVVFQHGATSGLPGYQTREHLLVTNRGPIPPTYKYTLDLNGIFSNLKGIEGWSYKIFPHVVPLIGGNRNGFMLHRDANVPGTLGCIGLIGTAEEYQPWVEFAKTYRNSRIPLVINYF